MAERTFAPGARVTYLRFPRGGVACARRLPAVVVRVMRRTVLVDAQVGAGETRRMRVFPENLEVARG